MEGIPDSEDNILYRTAPFVLAGSLGAGWRSTLCGDVGSCLGSSLAQPTQAMTFRNGI